MEKAYEMGAWCFDLPSLRHLESFQELKKSMIDELVIGLCHLEVGKGVFYLGKPLHQFESKVISTIRKDFLNSEMTRKILPPSFSQDVFTQKEIDRITFDSARFDEALSSFDPRESPFLLIGEKYGERLLALGRIDLLHAMVSRVRQKGFIPIFTGQWTTFILPKAKPLDVAAYAIPINIKWSHFDPQRASDLIKRFDKPVISLNPLVGGRFLKESDRAFSFLFDELKVWAMIIKVAAEGEVRKMVEALKKFPSLIPYRRT
jgi:hypothetical protein